LAIDYFFFSLLYWLILAFITFHIIYWFHIILIHDDILFFIIWLSLIRLLFHDDTCLFSILLILLSFTTHYFGCQIFIITLLLHYWLSFFSWYISCWLFSCLWQPLMIHFLFQMPLLHYYYYCITILLIIALFSGYYCYFYWLFHWLMALAFNNSWYWYYFSIITIVFRYWILFLDINIIIDYIILPAIFIHLIIIDFHRQKVITSWHTAVDDYISWHWLPLLLIHYFISFHLFSFWLIDIAVLMIHIRHNIDISVIADRYCIIIDYWYWYDSWYTWY